MCAQITTLICIVNKHGKFNENAMVTKNVLYKHTTMKEQLGNSPPNQVDMVTSWYFLGCYFLFQVLL